MSERSGIARAIINSLAFAREGQTLAGPIPVVDLPRLADVVVDTAGDLDCEVAGEQDRDGRAYLLLRVTGSLKLRCQRCLETVVEPLRIVSRFLLVPPGQPWPDDELAEDGFDAIAAEMEMVLLPLIEDEVLLALPIAPRHDSCDAPVANIERNGSSPFAVLGKLKKGV